MPHLITRQEALDAIKKTLNEGDCLACELLTHNNKFFLHKGEHTSVVLSQYPRTWGQTMVVLNRHIESISETTAAEWEELSFHIRILVGVIEQTLSPLRVYTASLGSVENLLHTCPHLHFNILPVYHREDRPESLFTWRQGVYSGTEEEWQSLISVLKNAWHKAAGDYKMELL